MSMWGCAKSSQTPREEDRDEIRAYFRSPAWLINRAWEIEGRKALSGWDFSVSTYNFVSTTSMIFKYAQTGTIVQLQELFQNRLASPLDTDEYGHTVLHHAARRGRFAICKFLVDNGAKRHITDYQGNTPVDLLTKQGFLLFVPDEEQTKIPNTHLDGMLNIIRLLMYETEPNLRSLSGFGGSEEAFLLLRQQSIPLYYSTPFYERAMIAFSLVDRLLATARLFQIALSDGELEADAYKYQDATGKSLLHAAAEAFGRSASLARSGFCWAYLFLDCVLAGCNVHSIRVDHSRTPSRRTPFLEIIHGFLQLSPMHVGTSPRRIEGLITFYLTILKKSGIDLCVYGREEKRLHDEDLVDKTFQYTFWPASFRQNPRVAWSSAIGSWDLIGFAYGPSPDDWSIWGSQPTDIFAGDFWRMIESPWERMPGAWLE
ncbi:hypothetical protein G7Y89_g8899 [Cudoniella acicularis]|uniref:Ankyrin n=1 Tax=Cudoniella acicularis TaxID=354080 RepID=A0A8H4W0M6_9HELO|nr:hypothetical protein G7Y89_g8899 [Cudoniella acicularis]